MAPAKALALREEAYRILGVDLTTIPAISVLHAQAILAELGDGISKFRSAGAFSSWMGLCPDNDISGGKSALDRNEKSQKPRCRHFTNGSSVTPKE